MRLGHPLQLCVMDNVPQSTATDVQQSLVVVKVKLGHIMMKCKSVRTELPNLRMKARQSQSLLLIQNEILLIAGSGVWLEWDSKIHYGK